MYFDEEQAKIREQQIIGIILNKPETVESIIDKLSISDFKSPETQKAYEIISKLYRANKDINNAMINESFTDLYGYHKEFIDFLNHLKSETYLYTAENLKELVSKAIDESTIQEMRKAIDTGETPEEIANIINRLEDKRKNSQEQDQKRPDNMKMYLKSAFNNDLLAFQNANTIKTGFINYDNKTGGLYPGLYVIGAISSLGKTTFIHQMCDNIARSGNPVLFFSLEQSKLELVTKSISRIGAELYIKENPKKKTQADMSAFCSSAVQIRQRGTTKEYNKKALEIYENEIADNINIIEGNFNTNVESIRNYTKRFMKTNSKSPVLVVDYLQIMQSPENFKGISKEIIDHNVTELKRISRDFNIPVFVISAFNRANYMTPVSFECFKESGNIEYTADVLIGLQLNVLTDKAFTDESVKINEKRKKIKDEKSKIPRQIQLCCIKNRNGSTSFEINFTYNPVFDLFIPADPPTMP